MNAVIDPVLSYGTTTPGLAELLTGAAAASETTEITSSLREACTARVAHLLSATALTPERRMAAALVFVRILTALKAALPAYLTTFLPPPS